MTAQTIETPATRANVSAWRDMPAGLTGDETLAYRRGYSAAIGKVTTAAGISVTNDGPSPVPGSAAWRMAARTVAGRTVAAHAAGHDAAHAAGIRAVRSMLATAERANGAYKARTVPLKSGKRETIPTPATDVRMGEILAGTAAPATRAPRKSTKLAPVPDVAPVPVKSTDDGRVTVVHVGAPGHPLAVDPARPVAIVREVPEAPAPAPAPAPGYVANPADTDKAHAAGVDVARNLDPCPADYVAARAWRKDARRQLAAMLRSRDLSPTGDVWAVATAAAGITTTPVAERVQ